MSWTTKQSPESSQSCTFNWSWLDVAHHAITVFANRL